MTLLRSGLLALLLAAACGPKSSEVVGPRPGESTAPLPDDPTTPTPDSAGVPTPPETVIPGEPSASREAPSMDVARASLDQGVRLLDDWAPPLASADAR